MTDLPTAKVAIDGARVAAEHARVSVFDRGLLYGDGVFEVLRTLGGRAVDLGAHLDRLYASCAALGLRPQPRASLIETVRGLLDAADERVRIVVTRGPGALAAEPATLTGGKTIVIVEPLGPQPTQLTAAIVDFPLPARAEPAHKTLAYLDHLRARELARAAGADEALRASAAGDLVEGATSNLFAVLGDTLIAPPDRGILPGIVRGRVLAIAAELAIPVALRPLAPAELAAAREIFVTSSLRGIVPIVAVDGKPTVAGPHGEVTRRIAARYSLCIVRDLDG